MAYFISRKSILKNTICHKRLSFILIKDKIINIDNLNELKEAREFLKNHEIFGNWVCWFYWISFNKIFDQKKYLRRRYRLINNYYEPQLKMS